MHAATEGDLSSHGLVLRFDERGWRAYVEKNNDDEQATHVDGTPRRMVWNHSRAAAGILTARIHIDESIAAALVRMGEATGSSLCSPGRGPHERMV